MWNFCKGGSNRLDGKQTVKKLREQIKKIQKHPNTNEVNKLNSIILGSHNYYKRASNVSADFLKIYSLVYRTLNNRLKQVMKDKPYKSKTYERLYGNYKGKIRTVSKVSLFPIYGIKNEPPMNFNQDICNYTIEGRSLIHKNVEGYNHLIRHLLNNVYDTMSVEFNDNRISLLIGQRGKCSVTGSSLQIGNMECNHKTPKSKGGDDSYSNLVWVKSDVHKLIHATNIDTINSYLSKLSIDDKGLKVVNSLRKQVGNLMI